MPTCTIVQVGYFPLLLILKFVEGWSLERDPRLRRLWGFDSVYSTVVELSWLISVAPHTGTHTIHIHALIRSHTFLLLHMLTSAHTHAHTDKHHADLTLIFIRVIFTAMHTQMHTCSYVHMLSSTLRNQVEVPGWFVCVCASVYVCMYVCLSVCGCVTVSRMLIC